MMTHSLPTHVNIAIIPAKGLGDGLIQMTIAYHLAKAGHEITFFHDFLSDMKAWFPTVTILPMPALNTLRTQLPSDDLVIFFDHYKARELADSLKNSFVFPKELTNSNISMLGNIVTLGKKLFNLAMTKENGVMIPHDLILRKYKKRTIIHPTSTDETKNWPAKKFLSLARKLKEKHFEPVFILSPKEQIEWKKIINDEFEMPCFDTIDTLARFVYESDLMIGNDSGIGHLASNLGLPTITIFSSKKRAQLWHPDWNQNIIVTPAFKIPGKLFKSSWKWLINDSDIINKISEIKI